jgi:hypothetical protein
MTILNHTFSHPQPHHTGVTITETPKKSTNALRRGKRVEEKAGEMPRVKLILSLSQIELHFTPSN